MSAIPGSGQRGTMEVVMGAKGWTMDDFKLASELKSAEQAQALCDNKIDAMVFTVGHPSGSIKEATTSCESILVPVDGPVIQKLADDNDYYATTVIPGGMYTGTDGDTPTFGVGATFVTSSNTDEETIYQIVESGLRELRPTSKSSTRPFANLEPELMITNNLSAPLHDGAVRYYKEKGWM